MLPVRISLVTPSFNQGRFIARTIDSVLAQQGDFELDYRVYDGGSRCGTLEILRARGERLRWVSERDRGQVDAVNRGLREATGDVVGWLNSDDVLAPGALARVAEAFASRPELEWLHGRCAMIDEDDREIRSWISAYKDRCARRYTFDRLLGENFVSQMTVFWRRRLLDEVGVLDPELKLAFDYDLWLRLAKRSAPLYIRELQASFRWYEATKSGSSFVEQFREDYEVARRHAPDRRRALLVKRIKSLRIVTAYRLMRVVRKFGRT